MDTKEKREGLNTVGIMGYKLFALTAKHFDVAAHFYADFLTSK